MTEPEIPGMADTRSLEHLIGFFMSLKINLFYFNYKIGVFILRDTQINFTTGSEMSVTILAFPQFVNCGFETADEVVVTGNICHGLLFVPPPLLGPIA